VLAQHAGEVDPLRGVGKGVSKRPGPDVVVHQRGRLEDRTSTELVADAMAEVGVLAGAQRIVEPADGFDVGAPVEDVAGLEELG
jgi:hypothetical protein